MKGAHDRLQLVQPERLAGLVVRVSTDRQALNDEGSLKTQLQRLREHIRYKAEAVGEPWSEAAVYELRGVSGKDSMRSKEFERLFADIRAGAINTVVCTSLDRICRSVRDFLHFFEVLSENGVEFVCLKQQYDTTSPQGRLFVTIMMALAQFEREQTAERTRDAVAARSQRGLWNGGRLLGYDLDSERKGYLVPDLDEAVVVNFAFDSYLVNGSIAETAEGMNRRGLRTKGYSSRRQIEHAPREFTYTTVQHLLKNVAYLGQKIIRDDSGQRTVEAVWPGIVDPDKFQRVQELMALNGRANHNRAKVVRHVHILGGGLLACGRCAGTMQGRSGTGKQGKTYFYYACSNSECHLRVVSSEVEAAVIDRIGALVRSEETIRALTENANAILLRELPEVEKRLRTLRRSLKGTDGEAQRLARGLASSSRESARVINDQLAHMGQRRNEIEAAILEGERQVANLERGKADVGAVRTGLQNFARVFAHLLPYEQRELVRLALRKVTLGDRELVLELYAGALGSFACDEKANRSLTGFAEPTIWLPDEDSNLEPSG